MAKQARAPIFKWETLKEIGPRHLTYRTPVNGILCEIELLNGAPVRVWRAEDRLQYFCHGLTFGGTDAPNGPISPFSGSPVELILRTYYELVAVESNALPNDVVVWKGLDPDTTPHSGILIQVVPSEGKVYLDDVSTTLQSKNGMNPEAVLSLEELLMTYGDTYNVFRMRDLTDFEA